MMSEGFGAGSIIQVQTSHVPTVYDVYNKKDVRVCGQKYL